MNCVSEMSEKICKSNFSVWSAIEISFFIFTLLEVRFNRSMYFSTKSCLFLKWCPYIRKSKKIYTYYFRKNHTLFRNKRFALNEMFQPNASKFAIFYIYENLAKTLISFFRFSFHATLFFSLMNALLHGDIDQGIHKVKI